MNVDVRLVIIGVVLLTIVGIVLRILAVRRRRQLDKLNAPRPAPFQASMIRILTPEQSKAYEERRDRPPYDGEREGDFESLDDRANIQSLGLPDKELYDGAIGYRHLENGQVIVLYPMLYSYRLCLGPKNDHGYNDGWDYPAENFAEALASLYNWDGDGDPLDGWVRRIPSYRRRPDGDASREYVRP